MVEVKLYKCEKCGKIHNSESECQKCEENHQIPISVEAVDYSQIISSKNKPLRIRVTFDDGDTSIYRL